MSTAPTTETHGPNGYHRTRTHEGSWIKGGEVTLYIGPDPDRAPRHGYWVVTEDVLTTETDPYPSRVGRAGPGSITPDDDVPTTLAEMKRDPRAVQWRTYSDDGVEEGVTYRGWWIEGTDDVGEGCDPLFAFAMPDAGDVNLDVKVERGTDWIGYLG